MTLVEITYELQSPLTEEQLRHLGQFANTYGLRSFRVDESKNQLSFEYDASRLRETQVAHVLGQASTREHVRVHWQMLRWAARQRQPQELAAQVLRIIGAAVLTAAGLVPEGNTGGGNVSAFRRLPVPPGLAAIIASVRSG